MTAIPLVLIAGFLGAGKTTFLRALTQALKEHGVDFSVVVNDFENAEIDASRLRGAGIEVTSIDGSCVCCSSLEQFMETLDSMEVPKGGLLLVEANGASDFISLIATISQRPECRRFTSPIQVTMVDAKRWQQRGMHNDLEQEQLRTSTHWMLTHAELLDGDRREAVGAAVQHLVPQAEEVDPEGMATFLQSLVEQVSVVSGSEKGSWEAEASSEGRHAGHVHHHQTERAFTSMRVQLPGLVSRDRLDLALTRLPEQVVRVKGLCRLEEMPQILFSFQHVRPGQDTIFLPLLGDAEMEPCGVVIGVGLPESEVNRVMDGLWDAEKDLAADR